VQIWSAQPSAACCDEERTTELEGQLNDMLVSHLPAKLLTKKLPCAADLVYIPYHGQHEEDDEAIRRRMAKRRDTILTSAGVMVKRRARRGGSARFSGVERPKNQVSVAKADPKPFCDSRRLWSTASNKFSAQQGWRHGVRSRSLGGIPVIYTR
jgi:hypothetical protein